MIARRDPKDQRKINKMFKTIKSANKSVIEDAIDRENTAVTIEGPQQPDEDDYGYVSQESSKLYKQLMEKYNASDSTNSKIPYLITLFKVSNYYFFFYFRSKQT